MRAVRMSAISHTFVECLKIHLCRGTNSEPHKCVYCSQIYFFTERFTWAELADIHLAYGSAYGKGCEEKRIFHERFPSSVCPDLSYVRFFRPSPTGKWYLCSEKSQHKARTIISHAVFDEGVLRRIPLQATAPLVTYSVWIVVLCGTLYGAGSLSVPSAEVASSTRPQRFPSSRQIHWSLHRSTEKPSFPEVLLFTDNSCFTRKGIFKKHNIRSKPSCCICCLASTTLCVQRLARHF
jgi:hypothetical protein